MIVEKKDKGHDKYLHLRDAPMPVVITNGPGFIIDFINEKALLFAHPRSEQADSLHQIFPDIFPPEVLRDIQQSCLVGQTTHFIKEKQVTYRHHQKEEVVWFDIDTQPVRDQAGTVVGTISFFTAVTDRVISRKSIDQREEYLGNFFKKAPVGIVCYRGQDFVVELANDKALVMWGKTQEEVIGKPIAEIFPQVESDETIRRRHHESLEKLKKGETHFVHEVELVFIRNGVPHTGWYTYIHEPYTNATGEIIGMMAVAIEVTDQVMARKKLQLITDALPSLISYINRNERYEFMNKAYEVWFGHSRNKIIGKSLMEVLGKAAYDNLKPHIDKVLSGERDFFENWINYKDGGKKYISASYIPHVDESKKVVGYFALINDLTDRKKSEESLQESEERLRLITDGINAGTFEYDLTTGSMILSRQQKRLIGFPEDAAIDREMARSIVHPEDFQEVLRQFRDLRSSPREFLALDYRIVRKDDAATRWMHSRSKILFSDTNGVQEPSRIIGFTIDITELKEKEEQLKQFNTRLELEVKNRTSELHEVNRKLALRNQELTNSQSFLKQLVDSSVEIICVIDKDLRYILANKVFGDKLQMNLKDVIGKSVLDVFPTLRNSTQLECMKRALAGETVNLNNYDSPVKPGMFIDTYYIPLKFGSTVEGVIIMARDVSKIIQAERALENLNRQLQEAQRLSSVGSWEWDISTGTVVWSDEMYRIYGYTEKFPVDFDKATELMAPEAAERSRKRMQQHTQDALENFKKRGELIFEISSIEFPINLPDGRKKQVRGSGKIELTTEGKLHRMLGAVQDVTEIRAAEKALSEKNKLLELKNKELESFTYVASHDLQEPLRKILTYADRIIRGDGKHDVENYMAKIDYSARRMRDLIQSMLQYGRLSTVDDPFEDVDLNTILKNMEADFELAIAEKRATIQSDTLPTIKSSAYQMNQLFFNLIGNSLKFSNGDPVIRIRSGKVKGKEIPKEDVDPHKEYWNLVVEDNGIGFDPGYKDRIFELFQRLHSSSEFSGTGIGLSIVKRIVERHNGFIDASSEPGKGARFSIWLPRD